ncbi:MAG: hypothetical protein KKB37_04745 [Alphaproteobacteria bacterium]|nr:hypothetical protein [Alphaproteobacteria bacterium]
MPELPDVENYRRYLAETAMQKRIDHVEVPNTSIVHGISARQLAITLEGHCLVDTHRHGKFLFATLDDNPPHDRLRLDFTNGYHLAFESQRMFSEASIVGTPSAFIEEHGLGLNACDPELNEQAFADLLQGRRGQIKSALMDQAFLAGIGNVYSDEILFQCRVHPKTGIAKLDRKTVGKLYAAMGYVLQAAIDHGAGTEAVAARLPGDFLLPHRVEGEPCPRCAGMIEKARIASRTSYFCPKCQRLENPGG